MSCLGSVHQFDLVALRERGRKKGPLVVAILYQRAFEIDDLQRVQQMHLQPLPSRDGDVERTALSTTAEHASKTVEWTQDADVFQPRQDASVEGLHKRQNDAFPPARIARPHGTRAKGWPLGHTGEPTPDRSRVMAGGPASSVLRAVSAVRSSHFAGGRPFSGFAGWNCASKERLPAVTKGWCLVPKSVDNGHP